MKTFTDIFTVPKPVIAMLHLRPLPGTPAYRGDWQRVFYHAMAEAEIYREGGVDGLIIENMHDVPYLKGEVGHEISTAMAIIGHTVKLETGLPCGVQVLAGANKAALAVAKSAGLDFIRAEGFVFAHIADEGLMESDAGELLRYRRRIDAESIPIFTDIKKKHSAHAITSDIDILEVAKAAAFFRSDGLVITGSHTGKPADLRELTRLQKKTALPILAGSGITLQNVEHFLPLVDGLIVGSWFKKKGRWSEPVDIDRVRKFMRRVSKMRI